MNDKKDLAVTALLNALDHPLNGEIETVRGLILGASPQIREAVKWNAPSYRTTDFFATVNLRSKDGVELVFHTGAKVKNHGATSLEIADPAKLVTWLAKDRCLVKLGTGKELRARRAAFVSLVQAWIRYLPAAPAATGARKKAELPAASMGATLATVPLAVRPIVEAARKTVQTVAAAATEVACQGKRPRSPSMMWKLARYAVHDEVVVTIGTFTKHASMFFARGAELEDAGGLLEGTGKKLRYITLRTPADAKTAAVKALVRQAFALVETST